MFNFFQKKEPYEIFEKAKLALIFSFKSETLTYSILEEIFQELKAVINIDFRNNLIHGNYSPSGKGELILQANYQFRQKESGDELLTGEPYHHCCPPNHIRLLLTLSKTELLLESELLNDIINMPNFNSLYVVNNAYLDAQNTPDLKIYKSKGMSTKGLVIKEVFSGIKEIDISKNTGYSTVIKDSWLMASWKMWFRNEFIDAIAKNDITKFPGPFLIQRNAINTFIQLYNKHNEVNFSKNIEIQKQFKKWIDFDGIIKNDTEL